MRLRENYQSKENRDTRFKELKAQGMRVHKSSVRNQRLHPEYVKDWQGNLETGIGNTQYQTFFAVLYQVEEDYS